MMGKFKKTINNIMNNKLIKEIISLLNNLNDIDESALLVKIFPVNRKIVLCFLVLK